jgi:hypothetical protein
MGQRIRLLCTGLAAVLGLSTAHATDTAGVPALSVAPPAAQWVERNLVYTYMGFTVHYTCEGLRDTVREVLLALGARKQDLKVRTRGCSRLEGPEPSPGVSATFSVLVPMTPDEIGKVGNTTVQPTRWQTVDLVKRTTSGIDHAPCELLEQLKDKALPLFTNRNLLFQATCVPHEISLGDIKFSVDVLRPASAAPAQGTGVAPAA